MELTTRETWTVIHGLILGAIFLLAFPGALAGLWSLRPGLLTTDGITERMRRMYVGSVVMAGTAWLTVITGTWIVYPWYRVGLAGDPPVGCEGLLKPSETCSPRDFLKSNVSGDTETWHSFGMEWKEHVAWASPILATAAAFLIIYYGPRLIARPWLRSATIVMFWIGLGLGVAGAIGTFPPFFTAFA